MERELAEMKKRTHFGTRMRKLTSSVLLVPFIFLPANGWAEELHGSRKETRVLADLSIEELMNEPVTSVSKKETKLTDSAAAIFVISQEDIRRSGSTSIPELLRMVPGLNVARMNANKWAVSARGFNGRWANKMLVLIDGRSVYTPLYSGVYWDVQDLVLEDIERIEIIRGPGATMWGANAVNGVINIITKRSEDTQGGLVSAVAGGEDRGIASVRYGGVLGREAHYRVYAKSFSRDNLVDASGASSLDRWNQSHGGFRTDWKLSDKNSLTVQGDIHAGVSQNQVEGLLSLAPPVTAIYNDRNELAGGNLLARWNHTFSSRSDIAVQFYYDQASRSSPGLSESRTTFDFDFQHHWTLSKRHDLVWGMGFRDSDDETDGSLVISYQPENFDITLFNFFAQDEITLAPDRLRLMLGAKLDHNSFTGYELQPTGRLLWTPNSRHSLWGSVSRAVSLPSRTTTGMRVNVAAFPGSRGSLNLLALVGNPQSKAEELLAHELGYRIQPSKRLFVDVATFYNQYDRLISLEPAVPFFEHTPPPAHLVIPLRFDNKVRGETYGTELAATFNATSRWKLSGSYSWLKMHLHRDLSSGDTTAEGQEGDSPAHQWGLRSQLTLPRNLELDTAWYFVSKLRNQNVPSYNRVDARLGWRLSEGLDLSVGIQNGLDRRHPEFGSGDGFFASHVKRTAYGRFTWRF